MRSKIDYIGQFEAYLLTERRVSDNTFQAYKCDADQLQAFLKKKKVHLKDCKKNHLKLYLKYLKNEGHSAKTVSRKISSLKLLFSFLHDRFNVHNSAHSLIFPKLEKKLPSYLTEQEIQNLLAAANREKGDKGTRNKVMLYLLYASGMRVTELVSLIIDQIQFDTGFIKVSGKGNKERLVPLPKNILRLLRHYLDHVYEKLLPLPLRLTKHPKKYLFPTCYKNELKPISRQSFWIMLKKMLTKAAIFKRISPHSLRHSLATHLLKKGADMRSLQMLLGHENLSTVQVYTHLENSELRKIYDKKHPRA